MARTSITRSASSDSTLSCITVQRDSKDALMSTPATSTVDAASVSTDAMVRPGSRTRDRGRVRRGLKTVKSSNENILSGNDRQSAINGSADTGNRTISGQTLVEEKDGTQRQLLHESIQAFDMDWRVGAMPGDVADYAMESQAQMSQKKSLKSGILDRASRFAENTKSLLGKRGREVMESRKERLQALTSSRRVNLRIRKAPSAEVAAAQSSCSEGPARKKTRLSQLSEEQVKSPPLGAKRKQAMGTAAKRWLSQGLYVGQDRDFDPRLTETKNKLKKASAMQPPQQQRSILPLPMFAGERTLEKGRNFRLPFEVFSPLPPGQPRPDEWRKTQKNVFIGDAANVWKKSKRLEASTCICSPGSGCDEDCFNRFMFYECNDSNCNIGADHCTNRSFDELRQRCKAGGKYNIGVEVIKTADRGHGVRSNRTFAPNQIIVEYAGEIITQDECEERMRKRYKDDECYYLMLFDQNMMIDATRGSIARFVNHSCEPNCRMIKWTVAGKPRMALFAGEKGIMTGEELTYDYNFDPFSSKNVQVCRCNSISCRGILGPKPKERELKDALQPLLQSRKRKFEQAIDDKIDYITKKRKLVVPSTIKLALATAKAQTSRASANNRIEPSSDAEKVRLLKKVSSKSLASPGNAVDPTNATDRGANATRKRTGIMYARKSSSSELPTQKKGSRNLPLSRRESVKAVTANVMQNIARSARGRFVA